MISTTRFPPSTPLRKLGFADFIGTIKLLRLPNVHFASFRFLHSAIPCLSTIFFLPFDSYSVEGLELFTRLSNPGLIHGNSGISLVPASPQYSFALFPRPRLDRQPRPLQVFDVVPDQHQHGDSNDNFISRLNSKAFEFAVYASQ